MTQDSSTKNPEADQPQIPEKKEAEDKESVFPASEKIQIQILSDLIFFPEKITIPINPKYFGSSRLKDIAELALEFGKKYGRGMSDDEFLDVVAPYLETLDETFVQDGKDIVKEILEQKGKDHEYARDRAFDFVQYQGTKAAIIKSVDLLQRHRDYKEIEKGIHDAININQKTTEASLMTGQDIQELDIRIDWIVQWLIPENAVTLVHGCGGVGKTWVMLQIAKAVSDGYPFMELETRRPGRKVIYVDFENPLPNLRQRVVKLDIQGVYFWHLSAEVKPPKLDSDDWELYKRLPKGSVLIFDSLRASQDGEENSSQDMGKIMGRLKELRELGFTIIVIHHTARANDKSYKGSSAISDLADHVLSLHRIKRDSLEEIEEDVAGMECLYFFGTKDKTRYERFHVFLRFQDGKFELAQDPTVTLMDEIAEFIKGSDHRVSQMEVIEWAKETGKPSRKKIRALLEKGVKSRMWRSERQEKRRVYFIND